jgi:hypothetical protein
MAASNQHLMLAQVQPGMVLSEELIDSQGQVLLPQGTILTAAMLALMPRHGIEILPILVGGVSDDEQAADRQQHQQRIERLFRKHEPDNEADWATGLLRSYIVDFRLDQGSGK